MKQANIKEITTKIQSFPSMPATGAKMLRMLEDPETTVNEIEDLSTGLSRKIWQKIELMRPGALGFDEEPA